MGWRLFLFRARHCLQLLKRMIQSNALLISLSVCDTLSMIKQVCIIKEETFFTT